MQGVATLQPISTLWAARKTYQVHWSSSANACGVLALLQVASDSAHGELQTSFAGSADLLLPSCLSFAASRHDGVKELEG